MEATREVLSKLYLENKMCLREMSETLGINKVTLFRRMKKFGIPTRKPGFDRTGAILSQDTKDKIAKAHLGKRLSLEDRKKRCTGSGEYKNNGYVFVRATGHPNEIQGGYVKRANLVIESKIGRYLQKGELVHHVNHIRDDDRPENLMLTNSKEHGSITAKDRWESGEMHKILPFLKGKD